jgi:hypothetical protein
MQLIFLNNRVKSGRLEPGEELHKDLNDMIRHSCNACASRVLALVQYAG